MTRRFGFAAALALNGVHLRQAVAGFLLAFSGQAHVQRGERAPNQLFAAFLVGNEFLGLRDAG